MVRFRLTNPERGQKEGIDMNRKLIAIIIITLIVVVALLVLTHKDAQPIPQAKPLITILRYFDSGNSIRTTYTIHINTNIMENLSVKIVLNYTNTKTISSTYQTVTPNQTEITVEIANYGYHWMLYSIQIISNNKLLATWLNSNA